MRVSKVLREERYCTTEIAGKVKCSKVLFLSRLRETGSVDDRKRSGRPKISALMSSNR